VWRPSRGVPGIGIVRSAPQRRMVVPAQCRARHVPMWRAHRCAHQLANRLPGRTRKPAILDIPVGESREFGRTFAAIANEVQSKKRPLPPPAAIIGGGETTVRIVGNQEGTGGPNQEFALAASLGMDDALNRHDVAPVFEALKDAIHTGAIGTNVHDLKLLLGS